MQVQEEMAEREARLRGLPTASDTADVEARGTEWPEDAFTAMVARHERPAPIGRPARHSYDGDGNMEALDAFPPFARAEERADLAAYTGAVGPTAGSAEPAHD
jgi:hypothetical protein